MRKKGHDWFRVGRVTRHEGGIQSWLLILETPLGDSTAKAELNVTNRRLFTNKGARDYTNELVAPLARVPSLNGEKPRGRGGRRRHPSRWYL